MLIGVRGRSPISVRNLEEGAVWKHENLKPKNVSSIDTKYLGFPTSDTGMVAFRTYTADEKQRSRADLLDARAPSLTRCVPSGEPASRRLNYVNKIERYSEEGKIDVGFNYADNGVVRHDSTS